MPKIDFDSIPDADNYDPIPEGRYTCRVDNIEKKTTQNGDEMWAMQFVVSHGEYEGRKLFDNLVFSEAAMKRVKLVCSRFGLDTTGVVDLTTDMLMGLTIILQTSIEDYEDDDGKIKKKNAIPFAGYYNAEQENEDPPVSGDEGGEEEFDLF